MRNISAPTTGDPSTDDLLFDTDQLCWWATELHPSALRELEDGLEGVFRRSMLKLLPAHDLGKHFHESQGRPSKELYRMIGLIIIAEFRNYTVAQTAKAYATDASIQYALDLPRKNLYLCKKTVNNYRKLLREDELAEQTFFKLTAVLIKELNLEISKQRLDSTHVLSNMAVFSRHQLLATGIKRFLNQLKRHHSQQFEALDETLRQRYQASDKRLYFGEVLNPSKVTAEEKRNVMSKIADDLSLLIDLYKSHPEIGSIDSYIKMERLFIEHFEIVDEPPESNLEKGDKADAPPVTDQQGEGQNSETTTSPEESTDDSEKKIKLRKSSVTPEGSKAGTLQNTSDEDAGYGGHKGSGHQAQISQSHPPVDEKGELEGAGMITGLIPESAAKDDSHAVEAMLKKQAEYGLKPDLLTADTAYGSDENVTIAAGFSVDLISPVSGKPVVNSPPKIGHREGSQRQKDAERRQRLDERRAAQETDEWKKIYAKRSGIEGVNRALDVTTGFKNLRVRGAQSVGMSLYFKALGWNINNAAKILAARRRGRSFGCVFSAKIRTLEAIMNQNSGGYRFEFCKFTKLLTKISSNLFRELFTFASVHCTVAHCTVYYRIALPFN